MTIRSLLKKFILLFRAIPVLAAMLPTSTAFCGEPDISTVTGQTGTRYGLFNLLDHRSVYGQGVFPEPFLVDESNGEPNEFRVDWLHTKSGDVHNDEFKVEVEKGFGLLTLELEVPFERERDVAADTTTSGFNNISFGARYPFYQYVSGGDTLDSTFGAAMEVGIPTNSSLSKNAEIVPKIFNDLRIGRHFTLQSILGYSLRFGSGDEGGLDTFEYGFVFGYTIPHKELPLPGVQQFIPVLELAGETELNKSTPGHNSLTANAGFRANLKAIGPVQPRIGIGFVFPVDKGAREAAHWGIVTSLIFEY